MFRTLASSCGAFALAITLLSAPSQSQTKLLRFPDIHGDRVAFCYAGDLWAAPSTGGTATRLTAHPGLEVFPKFSPDGAWIAFTGQYDGDEQVYVMPAEGGVPRQLTWYPATGPLTPRWGWDNQVYGWSSDGKSILFRSMRDGWTHTDTRLYTIPIEGGLPTPLPMPISGTGDLSPGGKQAVYSPLTRDFRTWKRYEGGWAQDLFIFDFATHALTPVANSPRTERDPMWIGNQIWFVSDRDGTQNLFAYDDESQKVEQATRETGFDVRWASRGDDGEIVYELGGELVVFDTRTKKANKISIRVPDDGTAWRPARKSAADAIENFHVSPKGERALFSARGDVFSAPIEKGPTRNLTHTTGVHERGGVWSPDGARVAFISDATGEEELYVVAQDGSGTPERLTSDGKERRQGLRWAPDGKKIVFGDKSGRIWCLLVDTKELVEVARDRGGNVGDYSWSEDSGWLAFSLADSNGYNSLHVWNLAERKLTRVTDELWNETEPYWDPAGKYLYFLSDREFAPQLMGLEWNFCVNRTTQIYALALRKDVPALFPPESDEVTVKDAAADAKKDEAKKDEKPKDEAKKDDEKKDTPVEPVRIDFDGLAARVMRVPVDADNYNGLSANKDTLFYVKSSAGYYGRASESRPVLMAFSLKERKAATLAEDCGGYTVCADGSKVLAATGSGYALYDASWKGKDSKKDIGTSGVVVDRVPKDEWRNIFGEVWRRFRDYFYVPNMHGYDWDALRKRYEPLLEHVAHRADLNYLLGEMIAELNVGHAYVSGGDWDAPERHNVALFGGRLELDKASKRYKLARILRGQNEEERYRSPLTEVGVDAKVGDYVLAIDGVELKPDEDPYRQLRDKLDRPVELTLNATPSLEGARKVRYRPIGDESQLFYLAFVLDKRERVEKLSGGKLAYLHVPDMGADGIREFIKWYYGQVRKEGLIIDDRGLGFRRRHLPLDVQGGEARSADRQTLVGRRGRHHESRPADRRRRRQRARVRPCRRARTVGRRRPRSRSRHRRRERREVGARRPRPAARARGGRGHEGDRDEEERPPAAPRRAGEDEVAREAPTLEAWRDGDRSGAPRVFSRGATARSARCAAHA